MRLTLDEQNFYEDLFLKLSQGGQIFDEADCMRLLGRGISDLSISNKIWNFVSEDGSKQVLSQEDFYRMLKYIAAYQNGYNLDEISLEELPELPPPKLPKKKNKKAHKNSENPNSTSSTPQIEPASNPEKEIPQEFESIHEETHLNPQADQSLAKPAVQPEAEENFENVDIDAEELKVQETIASELSESKKPGSENVVAVSKEEVSYPDDIETIEHVEMPDFEENLDMAKLSKLSNPFEQGDKEDFAAMESCEATTLSPRSRTSTEKYDKQSGVDLVYHRKSRFSSFSSPQMAGMNVRYSDYLELNQKIKIDITQSTHHNSGFMGVTSFVTYTIKSRFLDSEKCFEAERRYSDFDWLNCYFHTNSNYKGLVLPVLPEKKSIGNTDPKFIQQRKLELERYLRELGRHEILSRDSYLKIFLGEKGKEDLQTLKERKPMPGIVIPELDWNKMKELYEYTMASVKVKLKKETLPQDLKEANERINEVLKLDQAFTKIYKNLVKKEDLYKQSQKLTSNLNITFTKVINRANDEAYYSISSLSSLMVQRARNVYEEGFIVEDLLKNVKNFKAKLDGFKQGYALLISTIQEIGTNRELHKNRQTKLFEYRAESNYVAMETINLEMAEIEKKMEALEKEVVIIKDNLTFERKNLFEEFEIFMPDVFAENYVKQMQHYEKVYESWIQICRDSRQNNL